MNRKGGLTIIELHRADTYVDRQTLGLGPAKRKRPKETSLYSKKLLSEGGRTAAQTEIYDKAALPHRQRRVAERS